jgi:hypothetical protein
VCARYARHGVREHQHLANLVARRHELFLANTEPDADPLGRRGAGTMPGMGCAAAALDFEEQLERPLYERSEIGRP